MFLDSFQVLLDVLSDYVNYQAIIGAATPVATVLILALTIVFAWRSTEVSTDDDVQGQFTIPGRGTFNVINPNSGRSSSRAESPPTEGASPSSENDETEEFDAGDETETEVAINVRYLDESVKSCRFRPSQSLGHFKQANWADTSERRRVCLIYAGKALRDDKVKMSRIGLKEGDTMHAFYRSPENERNNNPSSGASGNTQNVPPPPDGDDFDELARYFLPLAGSLLVMTWFYVLSSPIMLSVSTLVALLFITLIYTGFAVYNFRSIIF